MFVKAESTAGDTVAASSGLIEVRVAELRQLLDAMDPSPFRSRDLDPSAEEFIVSWSRELPRDAALALLVHLDRAPGPPDEAQALRNAVQQHFRARGDAARLRLRRLFARGRVSLLIGLTFLGLAIGASQLIQDWLAPSGVVGILRESLLIGGWVAMWRPIEIFLYDWWPIHADVRLYDRLAAMPVRIKYAAGTDGDAWREDWPAAAASRDR